MVPAWDERKSIRYGGITKRSDPIGHLLLKYEFSPESELVEALCRACAQEQFDETVWTTIRLRIQDLTDTLNAVDAGIVIKSVMMYTRQDVSKTPEFGPVIATILRKIASRRTPAESVGSYTILYCLQSLNHFKDYIEPDTLSRYFSIFISRLVRGERIPKMHTTALINTVQTIVNRPSHVKLSSSTIDAFITELIARVSRTSPADVPERDPPDVDGLFGLMAASAKLPLTQNIKQLFSVSKSLLFANNNQYLNLLTFEQLVGTVHAFSRLGPASLRGHVEIFQSIGNLLVDETFAPRWNPRLLANAINAFGTAAVLHGDLMSTFSKNSYVRSAFDDMEPFQTAMCMHGLSKLGLVRKHSWLVKKAEQHLVEMNLHSVAKIITSMSEDMIKKDVRERLVESSFQRALQIAQSTDNVVDVESLILILQFAIETRTGICMSLIQTSFPILSSNLESVGDFVKISRLVHDACVGLGKEEHVVRLATTLINHIHQSLPLITLADYVRIMYGFSIVSEPSTIIRDQIVNQVRCRAHEINNLSYRPLTRLKSALSRLATTDMDILDLIEERQAKLNS